MKRQKVRSKMGVKEKALTAASSIASGDFLRMVTGGGASRKIDYSKLAKAIVEEYNGSTIAGSAQTLKVALDSLNSNAIIQRSLSDAGITDLNNIQVTSVYSVTNSVPVNAPVASGTYAGYVWTYCVSPSYKMQMYVKTNSEVSEIYSRRYLNGTWSPWFKYTGVIMA